MRRIVPLLLAALAYMPAAYGETVNYVIEGAVDSPDGKKFYILDYDTDEMIDSATVAGGRLRFEGCYSRKAFVRVDGGREFSNCILDTLAVVDFNTRYPSGGSQLNCRLRDAAVETTALRTKLDAYSKELADSGLRDDDFWKVFKASEPYNAYNNLIEEISVNNPNGIGEAYATVMVNLGMTPDEWDRLYARLPQYLKDREGVKRTAARFAGRRNTEPGKPFVEVAGKNTDGSEVRLSEYVGTGKYVLVDFWASWCGPCRKEAAEVLIPLYEKYAGDDRFEIVGVAVWDAETSTVKALDKYKYPWPQIIGTGNKPMLDYGFNAIPMLILFGPDGTILARDLRGETLVQAVEEALGE